MMRPRRRRQPKTEETPEIMGDAPETASEAPETVSEVPTTASVEAPPAHQRYIINLNMLSNVDIKFYTEGVSRVEVIARWRTAIGRAKREQPEDSIEVVMGQGDGATSFILFLAEVTAFAVGPFADANDVIECVVNI